LNEDIKRVNAIVLSIKFLAKVKFIDITPLYVLLNFLNCENILIPAKSALNLRFFYKVNRFGDLKFIDVCPDFISRIAIDLYLISLY
jgi:hypothetical protein